MPAKFRIGQKVIVRPIVERDIAVRGPGLEAVAGRRGQVTNLYSISPGGRTFFIYTVRIGNGRESVVVHEDELEPGD